MIQVIDYENDNMQILRHLRDISNRARGGAVAIGNFDGVHRGHVRIVERLLERAREVGGPALVFTFDPHPVRLLRPDQHKIRLHAVHSSQGLLKGEADRKDVALEPVLE